MILGDNIAQVGHNSKIVKTKSLVTAHLNVRSLNTGFDEFANYIYDCNFDILGLSETWLTSDWDSSSFNLEGYNLIRKDRGARGGGVGAYVRKHISSQIVDLGITSESCEYVGVRIKPK